STPHTGPPGPVIRIRRRNNPYGVAPGTIGHPNSTYARAARSIDRRVTTTPPASRSPGDPCNPVHPLRRQPPPARAHSTNRPTDARPPPHRGIPPPAAHGVTNPPARIATGNDTNPAAPRTHANRRHTHSNPPDTGRPSGTTAPPSPNTN